MSTADHHYNTIPTFMTAATLDQAAPVQNTYYTVLDTTLNVIVDSITLRVETTGEDLQLRITVDGVTLTSAATGVAAGTNLYAHLYCVYNAWYLLLDSNLRWEKPLLMGRSVKVEVRKTTAAGAGNLKAAVGYNQH